MCIRRHPQRPLAHRFLHHGIASPHGQAVLHLIIRQHGSQFRAPVHHRVPQVGNAVVHQHLLAFLFALGIPFLRRKGQLLATRRIQSFRPLAGKGCFQFTHGASLLPVAVIIAVEHLDERPLRPFVILGVTSAHLPVPVIRKADFVQLLAVTGNVFLRGHGRVLPGLDGVLFRRQTIGIKAHRVQHIESFQALVPGINVRSNVAQRMPHVKPCPRRIGKHVKHVKFRLSRVNVHFIGSVLFPELLPLLFGFFKIIFHKAFQLICKIMIQGAKIVFLPERQHAWGALSLLPRPERAGNLFPQGMPRGHPLQFPPQRGIVKQKKQ